MTTFVALRNHMMIVRYVDLSTGRRAEDRGITPHSLIEGNWSCDCNRGIPFFGPPETFDTCAGYERFIVYDVEQEEGDEQFDADDVIMEANDGYYRCLQTHNKVL